MKLSVLGFEQQMNEARAEGYAAGYEAGQRDKDQAYLERNHLVAALARLYPSGVRKTDIPGWSADWHSCCFIDLPSGQVSYHFHDSHAQLFSELPTYDKPWDGHDKDVVHQRLAVLPITPPPAEAGKE